MKKTNDPWQTAKKRISMGMCLLLCAVMLMARGNNAIYLPVDMPADMQAFYIERATHSYSWPPADLWGADALWAMHMHPIHPQHTEVASHTWSWAGANPAVLQNTDTHPTATHITHSTVSEAYVQQLMNFEYLRHNIFLEDPSTMLLPSDIDVLAFLAADLHIDTTVEGPQVLIFHTHSNERFIDSIGDPMSGIMGTGAYLAQILTTQYGLNVLHYMGRFDMVDGREQRDGSYSRMDPVITRILADNPSIQLVIDLHRDGVIEGGGPFTTVIDGVPTARIMFFNGLSRRRVNGQPQTVTHLPNRYQRENLTLSFRAQLSLNYHFPGLSRRIYLRAFRYSLHMHPNSMLVEVGNQYNTQQEARNAMHHLAHVIADVMLGIR